MRFSPAARAADSAIPQRIPASGIVLAGGRSSRFGGDKLAVEVDGRPLLAHAIEAVAGVCNEVIVVLAPDADPQPPPTDARVPVRVVHDAEPYAGPLAGLVAGLEHAAEPLVLVVGGDMPTLAATVLQAVVSSLAAAEIDAVALEHQGRFEPLPMAVRLGSALPLATDLVRAGERSLLALLRSMHLQEMREAEWRTLDPSAETLHDIDEPADLNPGVSG